MPAYRCSRRIGGFRRLYFDGCKRHYFTIASSMIDRQRLNTNAILLPLRGRAVTFRAAIRDLRCCPWCLIRMSPEIAYLCTLAAPAATGFAQLNTTCIRGIVRDPSRAVFPDSGAKLVDTGTPTEPYNSQSSGVVFGNGFNSGGIESDRYDSR